MIKIILTAFIATFSLFGFAQKPSPDLINPSNHTLLLIDFEGQMAFATKSIDVSLLRNNTGLVAGASKIFNVPTVITTVAE